MGGLVLVPNSATDLTTTNSYICQISITNITTSSVTVLIKDRASTQMTLVDATIPAKTIWIQSWPWCIKMTGGISWTAGTVNALHSEVYGFKQ